MQDTIYLGKLMIITLTMPSIKPHKGEKHCERTHFETKPCSMKLGYMLEGSVGKRLFKSVET